MSPPRYPLLLDLAGVPVLVVGAGRVATRKVRRLLEAGAQVRLVSPEASPELAEAAAAGRLEWRRRGAEPGDLEGARLAFLAASDPAVNAALAAEAAARGVWVNRADVRGGGDFQVPAVATRGPARVMLSTGGQSPALAKLLRRRVEALLDQEFTGLLEGLARAREELTRRGLDDDAKRSFWDRFPDAAALEAMKADPGAWEREVEKCVSTLSA